MNTEELRLACLRLAAEIYKGRDGADVLTLAGQLYDFITTGDVAPSPR